MNTPGANRIEVLDVVDPASNRRDRVAFLLEESQGGKGVLFVLPLAAQGDARSFGAGADASMRSFAGARYVALPQIAVPVTADRLRAEGVRIPLNAPLRCEPCAIAKPWGREIWWTGFEARGVCVVGGVPLPWLLAGGREAVFGEGLTEIILLKILDPMPVPVRGDLYTEVHAEKNEVYVCTHVDPGLYPNGVGALRYGIAPAALTACGGDISLYKNRYLAAVKAYETVRRRLDEGLGAPPSDAAGLAREQSEEQRLRAEMDAFTALHPLQKGSVARVPVGVPHALQAGVRVVEFQTATYERAIVSFAQKVVTQDHWDTERALALLNPVEAMRSPLLPEPEDAKTRGEGDEHAQTPHVEPQRIVDFPGFEVWRLRTSGPPTDKGTGKTSVRHVGNPDTYELLHVVETEGAPGGEFPTEGAWLVPRGVRVSLAHRGLTLRALPRVRKHP